MTDYIAQVAELLKNGETVIFYTVGSYTFLDIRELKERFHLTPTAICDKDPNKQGRTWKGLEGVRVISPEQAMEQFPNTRWYICSLDYRYQIIGYLTEECDIPPKNIINYISVRKMISCPYLQHDLYYNRTGDLGFCCWKVGPYIPADEGLNVAGLHVLRDETIKAMEEGWLPSNSPCVGCSCCKEDYYPVEPKGYVVNYFCNSVCNYHCSYCGLAHTPVESHCGRHTVGEIIQAYRQEELLSENYTLGFVTAGEPTLYPKRKEVYRNFDGENFLIDTNGFLFDQDLFELMDQKRVFMLVSIDAGTRETYRKIKGSDGFLIVRKNLKKYAQAAAGIVALKYIMIPGENDNPEDIDGFVDFCKDTDASLAMFAVEFSSVEKMTDYSYEMVHRMVAGLSKNNILCIRFRGGTSLEYEQKIHSMIAEDSTNER